MKIFKAHSAKHQRQHQRELAQFLPAALEIQETPPHPLARWLTWSLIALVLLAVSWAYLGQVNIVATAEGKIIPSSRVKDIQTLETAVVKAILVKEGQYVAQGDALIELDNTATDADQSRLSAELVTLQNTLRVSEALLELLALPEDKQANLSRLDIRLNHSDVIYSELLWQQWQQYWSQYQSLQQSLNRTQAEQAATQAQIDKLQQTLPIITKRSEKIQALMHKNFATEEEYLTLEQQRIENQQDLLSQQQGLKQLQATEKDIEQQHQTINAQAQAQQLIQITDTQTQIAAITEELTKAKDRNDKTILYAPTSGKVQELKVSTIGGVVTEAQTLMRIVPNEDQLEVEVFLENKDIGFIEEGMLAEIKIHTFPFTKYGIIEGEVLTVSDDATLDEQRGLIYGMRLLMNKNSLRVNNKEVQLIPGMAVTAEMRTGHRRIIEFFLAPLLRYQSEGLRER